MAPVVAALRERPGIRVIVAATGQHREMLDQVLHLFDIRPDHDLDVMRPDQSLAGLFSAVLSGMTELVGRERPDLVLVHGDTSTTLATALAAFYNQTPLGHVEAGLRTGNMRAPWPEEANRRLTAPLAAVHFAPTPTARDNLLAEGIPASSIHVTGNTVIDALLQISERIDTEAGLRSSLAARFPFLRADRRLLLVTGHRRENLGDGFQSICQALRALAARPDVQLVYPVHLNPKVRMPVQRMLEGAPNIHLLPPQDYLPFVYLLKQAHLVITDSGGIQEEAPALGKPVLVMRETTERPEAVEAGTVRLVGASEATIVAAATELLDDDALHGRMARSHNPYGDGRSAERIASLIGTRLDA
jgi:UDP-N-acetylglucosamine 2-epimerase (non-hydrolysing)